MKHYSATSLRDATLLTDDQLRELLQSRLRGLTAGRAFDQARIKLAAELGVKQAELSRLLRGQMRITPAIAEKLGLRAVTRFEPIG